MGSSVPQYSANHVINPETGFLENPAFLNDFDSARKQAFLDLYLDSGLSLYDTCAQLSLSYHTVNKHYQRDPKFKQLMDQKRDEYASRLDGVSKRNAMNPKSVIERIFQLKSLFPEKYADQKNQGKIEVTINVDSQLVSAMKKREEVLEAEQISPDQLPTKTIDNQGAECQL